MLNLSLPEIEFYDEHLGKFIKLEAEEVNLEHSLVSLSKWESKWHVPFLSEKEKTRAQIFDYAKCMIIDEKVPPNFFGRIDSEIFTKIANYINEKMTATWFRDDQKTPRNREIITNELIYYWMTVYNIPFSCEEWHLSRLLTLIKVCSHKNAPPKKLTGSEARAQQRALNRARQAEFGTRG